MNLRKRKDFIFILAVSILCFIVAMIFLKYVDYNVDIPQIQATPNNISAAIVPFDQAARNERRALLQQISTNSFGAIVVLAPIDKSGVFTADRLTKLPNTTINLDTAAANNLQVEGQALIQNDLFDQEAFRNLITDVNNFFPDPRTLPLLISNDLDQEKRASLISTLDKNCLNRCLLVAATDFAQNVPGSLSEIQDDYSVRALSSMNDKNILKADIGSVTVAALAADWSKLHLGKNFHLYQDLNLAEKTGDSDSKTKSFVTGWFEQNGKTLADESFNFVIGGDMMFDRLISYKFPKDRLVEVVGNLGSNLFLGTDLGMVNLEGPIAEIYRSPDISPSNMTFEFPPKTTDVLQWLKLNAVSLANNHTLNGGEEMLAYTKSILTKKGIVPLGDQTHVGVQNFGGDGKTLTVIAIDTFGSSTNIETQIKKAKSQGRSVLIFPHWGSEYQTIHSASQTKLAHDWIDDGADLVIGSHPHVIQDAEIYQGKPVFYSLGNLLFDQTFSKATQQGLLIAGKITDEKLTLVFLPTVQKNLKPELMVGEERFQIISKLKSSLGLDSGEKVYGYDRIVIDR